MGKLALLCGLTEVLTLGFVRLICSKMLNSAHSTKIVPDKVRLGLSQCYIE